MIASEAFALLRPYWLLCLPALWLFLKYTRKLDMSLGDWPRAVDPPLLDALAGRRRQDSNLTSNSLMIWCLVLIILSLCGPATRVATSSQFRNLDAALIIMNVSSDSNISQITSAAQIVLKECGARQIGLILYAGDAYLASPLTYDLASIEALIFAVDAQTIPDGGSRPERALELGHLLLRRMNIFAGDVVLIGDGSGVNAQANQEAKSLAVDGHSLHTLFVSPSITRDTDPPTIQSVMKQLARDGHGIAGDTATASIVAEAIAARRIEHVARSSHQALEWRDWGRIIIVFAALPLLIMVRRAAL